MKKHEKTAKSIDKDLSEQHSTSPTQTHRHPQTRVVKPKKPLQLQTRSHYYSNAAAAVLRLRCSHKYTETHTQLGEKVKKLKVKENNYHCKSMNMRIYFLTHIIANYYS